MTNNIIGIHKTQLDTPCLVIDYNKLIHNLKLMQNLAIEKKVHYRPHAKTHKSSQIAKLQLEHGAIGICVTKVSEALSLAKSGISGILITSPVITTIKIDKLLDVVKIAPDTIVVVDNLSNATNINNACTRNNIKLNVLLDIDSGIGRTGVSFENAITLATKINNLNNLVFQGIQCYAGHIQHIANLDERRTQSHAILTKASAIKKQLTHMGINCKIQTGSGTGTFSIDSEIPDITEIQPGSYCVMDQEYNNIEYKDNKFLEAMTMLSTVISTNHKTHVTIDAGTKALYKVITPPKVISHDNLVYDWDLFGDEHGKISLNMDNGNLPILGEQIELVVAHCDPTINLFDKFYITENDIVIDIWDINLRGCCR